MAVNSDPMAPIRRSSGRGVLALKIAGTVASGWTALILAAFAVGEGAEGIGHVITLVPLVAAIALAWRSPMAGGAILVAVGGAVALFYLGTARGSAAMVVSTELLMLAPPVLGGILFLLAGRLERAGSDVH